MKKTVTNKLIAFNPVYCCFRPNGPLTGYAHFGTFVKDIFLIVFLWMYYMLTVTDLQYLICPTRD